MCVCVCVCVCWCVCMCFLFPLRGQAHCYQTEDLRLSVESRGRGLAWRGRESLSASWGSRWRDRDGLGVGWAACRECLGARENTRKQRGREGKTQSGWERRTQTHTRTHTHERRYTDRPREHGRELKERQ